MISALDTNVVSAIWSREPGSTHVLEALKHAAGQGGLVVCGVVYAELLAYPRVTEDVLTAFFAQTGLRADFVLDEGTWRETGFRFAAYAERRRRETPPQQPKRLIADFVIGAHALLRANRLITLDRQRYTRDFPELLLLDIAK